MKSFIKIGTRGSQLALYQAELVQSKLSAFFPEANFEFVKIKTSGDIRDRASFISIGPGIFTREIETALLKEEIDLAVHSAKDLASELPTGLTIGAILQREDVRDCFISRKNQKFSELRRAAKIGTSSLRRKAQLRALRPDLLFEDIRGNVDTRIKKVEQGLYDGMVLAYAGIKRLGFEDRVTEIFDSGSFLPQAGQGAIAVEVRQKDDAMKEMTKKLNDPAAFQSVLAERSFLRTFRGGCQLPAGIYSNIQEERIYLKGAVFSVSSAKQIVDTHQGSVSKAEQLGQELAEKILSQGGQEILKEIQK